MSTLFGGSCKHCKFVWMVADRRPNFCPECGKQLYASTEEFIASRVATFEYELTNSDEGPRNHENV